MPAGFLLAKDIFNLFQKVVCYALSIGNLAMDGDCIYPSVTLENHTRDFLWEPVVEELEKNFQVMRSFLSWLSVPKSIGLDNVKWKLSYN